MIAPTRHTERAAREALRALPADGSFVPIEREECADLADGARLSVAPIKAWKSRAFVVQLFAPKNGAQRISVHRAGANGSIRPGNRDRRPISWDELMAVKSAIGFGDRWAVEIYPPDAEVVDVAMMRHLFLCDRPGFAW